MPDTADLERGRTTALLGALGQMQQSLDVLVQEQRAARSEQLQLLLEIERRVAMIWDRLAAVTAPRPAPAASPPPAAPPAAPGRGPAPSL